MCVVVWVLVCMSFPELVKFSIYFLTNVTIRSKNLPLLRKEGPGVVDQPAHIFGALGHLMTNSKTMP